MVRLDLFSQMAKVIVYPVSSSTGGGYLKRREKVIRLALKGCANRPFFHVVITNKWRPRDAPPYEQVGTYDPMPNEENQKLLSLNLERIRYWIGRGTTFSSPMEDLLGRIGFLPINPYAQRNAWKLRRAAAKELQEQLEKEKTAEGEKS
ncbi:unnamed protein product [Allacma fusca]|uniref:Small ribosomal subunit protein bS16m n=1 Tax=Allacma fusca TaxID=39272 RepID=A0A8J2NM75_9HEXA|nr:unnamed protein product [Allacma fusca]